MFDIDLGEDYGDGEGWEPIGSVAPFTGVLDGDGHEISGLYIDRPTESVGLFGSAESAQMHNLFLRDVDISGQNRVGALAAHWQGGSISRVAATGRVSGELFVGGLVGLLDEGGSLEDSAADVVIDDDGLWFGGGLVGGANDDETAIRRSFALGSVSGEAYIGGLIGHIHSGDVQIAESFARGNSFASDFRVGGMIGQLDNGLIERSYATGLAETPSDDYALVGCCSVYDSEVALSYWDINSSRVENSFAGIGLSTRQMQDTSSYDPSWDFDAAWARDNKINAGYPYLRSVFEDLLTEVSLDSNAELATTGGSAEPLNLNTTTDSAASAMDVFTFSLSDAGGDGVSLQVWEITVAVAGTATDAERNKVTWRLDGAGVNNVAGEYDSATQTITFKDLVVTVADGASETYTVNAYFSDNSG
ncbi:MAG: hypothetical protein WD600_05250, partial [Pseudohongiella sp.]